MRATTDTGKLTVIITVSIKEALRAEEAIRDTNLGRKLGVEVEQPNTNVWEVRFDDTEYSFDEISDEFSEMLNSYGITEFSTTDFNF